jgi:RNA polymerase sigma factor (sigma-70 family)
MAVAQAASLWRGEKRQTGSLSLRAERLDMATGQLNSVIQHLRRTALLQDEMVTDGQLLDGFLTHHEETAFEALVRRHGAMVLSVCRRLLHNEHDAEDAFQATFLVLVRKAASLRPRDTVGNWLYGVAYNTALKARAQAHRRRAKETVNMPKQQPPQDPADWQPVLDEELNRLPDKYREAIVLCDLEGKTREQAGRQLGLPAGTLSGRLTTARRLLAKRLTRRGVTLSAGALATALAPSVASATVQSALVANTVKAAAVLAAGQVATGVISAQVVALTEGVLKAMLMTKLKVTAAFLVAIGLFAVGGGTLVQSLTAGDRTQTEIAAENPIPSEDQQFVAQRPKRPETDEGPKVSGKLDTVDADKRSVTITTPPPKRGEAPTAKTFPLGKDAKIQRDGKDVKLADLKKGTQATLTLSKDQATVVSLSVTSPGVSGPVKSLDVEKYTITITVGNRAGKEDKTYQVAKDAKIVIDGKDGRLADLKVGATVSLIMSEANTVTQVRSATGRRPRNEE